MSPALVKARLLTAGESFFQIPGPLEEKNDQFEIR